MSNEKDHNPLTRVDFYYADGTCKTAIGQQALNFQSNFNNATLEVIKGKELLSVKFEDRKIFDEKSINLIVSEFSQDIFLKATNFDLMKEYLVKAIKKTLFEQKTATLKDLVADCPSNGYQLLFDLASMLNNAEAGNLIKQAATILLKK